MPRRVRRPSDWNDPDLWEYDLDDQGDRIARLYHHGATFYADLSVLTELWLRRCRTVTGVGCEITLKPRKYSSVGASRSSLPPSARRITPVAVTILVIENHR
jgi:hypothetical protein